MFRIRDFERLESRHLMTAFTPIQLADITPGSDSSTFGNFVGNEKHLYFNANGSQLWRTDGTSEGTAYLANLRTNDSSNRRWNESPPPADIGDGRATVFNTRSGITSTIWKTDGTEEGTFKFLADRRFDRPPAQVNEDWSLATVRNHRQIEFWRFGVNDTAPLLLGSIEPPGFNDLEITVQDGHVFVNSTGSASSPNGGYLYRTDGTVEGTQLLTDALTSSVVQEDDSNLHYFAVNEGRTSWYRFRKGADEPELAMTIEGVARQLRFHKGGFQYYLGSSETDSPTWQLVFSDGTETGSRYWTPDQHLDPVWLAEFGDDSLFGGRNLFKTDGTVEGTSFVATGSYLGQIDQHVYLGSRGNFMYPVTHIHAVTDGTDVFDAWTGDPIKLAVEKVPSLAPPPSQTVSFFDQSGLVRRNYRSGNGGFHTRVSYYAPGENGVLELVHASPNGGRLFEVEDQHYFFDASKVFNEQAILVGQTSRHDFPKEDLDVAEGESRNGTYFSFGRRDAVTLWRLGANGSMVEIAPVAKLSANDRRDQHYFFTAHDELNGHELWVTDGSPDGTYGLDIWPGTESSDPEFISWQCHTVFIAGTPTGGRELWSVTAEPPTEPKADVDLFRQLIQEDSSVTFQANVSNATPVSYSWDLNNDGIFGDAIGSAPALTTTQLDDLNPPIPRNVDRPYHVMVTTDQGQTVRRTSLLRISNEAPEFKNLEFLPREIEFADVLSFELPVVDDDPMEFSVDFGDGTVTHSDSPVFSHQFEAMGKYQITITAEDVHRSVTSQTFTVSVTDSRNSHVFAAGRVFGGKQRTTDLAVSNDDYDFANSIDRIVSASADSGNQTTHLLSSIDEWNRVYTAHVPGAHTLALGRIDRDHKRDLLLATPEGLFGPNGQLEFGIPWGQTSDIAVGDLNGDGFEDAFVARSTTAQGAAAADFILLNRGGDEPDPETNSYLTFSGFVGDTVTNSVELVDLNGDDSLDVITAGDDAIRIWFNDGVAQLQLGQQLPIAANFVGAGDVDDDGDMDLIAAADGSNSIWLNDGYGLFIDSMQRLGNAKSNHVALGDLDDDFDLDLMFANAAGDATTVWWNDGAGRFDDSGVRLATDLEATKIILHDVSFDGGLDAIVAFSGSANRIFRAAPDLEPPKVTDIRWKTNSNGLEQLTIEFSEATIGSVDLSYRPDFRLKRFNNVELEWNRTRTTATAELAEFNIPFVELGVSIDVEDRRGNELEREERFRRIEIDRAMEGDINQDLLINDADFSSLLENFGRVTEEGDLNRDGIVDFADFLILSANFDR